MDDGGNLWVAVVGGAIGTSLTGLFVGGARILAAWREVAAHERAVRERDEDLEQWVVDETVRLTRGLRQKVDELNARNLFYSGEMHHQAHLLSSMRGERRSLGISSRTMSRCPWMTRRGGRWTTSTRSWSTYARN